MASIEAAEATSGPTLALEDSERQPQERSLRQNADGEGGRKRERKAGRERSEKKPRKERKASGSDPPTDRSGSQSWGHGQSIRPEV